jgi:hypothetical protein
MASYKLAPHLGRFFWRNPLTLGSLIATITFFTLYCMRGLIMSYLLSLGSFFTSNRQPERAQEGSAWRLFR